MTDRVQFREDAEVIAYVQSLGLNPNELARGAFQKEVRRLRAMKRAEILRSFKVRLGGESSADLVRQARDSR